MFIFHPHTYIEMCVYMSRFMNRKMGRSKCIHMYCTATYPPRDTPTDTQTIGETSTCTRTCILTWNDVAHTDMETHRIHMLMHRSRSMAHTSFFFNLCINIPYACNIGTHEKVHAHMQPHVDPDVSASCIQTRKTKTLLHGRSRTSVHHHRELFPAKSSGTIDYDHKPLP